MAFSGDSFLRDPPSFEPLYTRLGLEGTDPELSAEFCELVEKNKLEYDPAFGALSDLIADWCEDFESWAEFTRVDPILVGKFTEFLVRLGQGSAPPLGVPSGVIERTVRQQRQQ